MALGVRKVMQHAPTRIGVISGSGPDAGINIMQKILNGNKERLESAYKSDKDAPYIMLYQVPTIGGPHGAWDLEDRSSPQFGVLWNGLTDTITNLDRSGADCVCLTCNTLHVLEEDLREWMKRQGICIPFISIIEATKQAIVTQNAQCPRSQSVGVECEELPCIDEEGVHIPFGLCEEAITLSEIVANDEKYLSGAKTSLMSTTASHNNFSTLSPDNVTHARLTSESCYEEDEENEAGNGNESPKTIVTTVYILGTLLTTDLVKSPYARLSEEENLHVKKLHMTIRDRLQNLIGDVKRQGPETESLRKEFWSILMEILAAPHSRRPDTMKMHADAETKTCMVFACTELPLLLDEVKLNMLEDQFGCKVIDPNRALSQVLLDFEKS